MRKVVRVILLEEADKEYKKLNELVGQQIKEGKEHTEEIQLLRSIKQKRDKTEARNLTELAQNNDVKIVHVGGNIHNLTDSRSETLYSRLAKFNPSRTTLFAYDK
jgi:hypothetical protein